MRIVLDTSVLISALISEGSPPQLLYDAWSKGAFDLIISAEQMTEIRNVIYREKMRRYFSLEDAHVLIESVTLHAEWAESLPHITASPDPEDNKILATAIAGRANYLISGDKNGLLALEQIEGIRILTPRDALIALKISS